MQTPQNRQQRRKIQREYEKIQRMLAYPASKRDVAVAVRNAVRQNSLTARVGRMFSRLTRFLNQRVKV